LSIKRALLERAVADDPEPTAFEGWLLEHCLSAGGEAGATRAMALEVLAEWRAPPTGPRVGGGVGQGAPSEAVGERARRRARCAVGIAGRRRRSTSETTSTRLSTVSSPSSIIVA